MSGRYNYIYKDNNKYKYKDLNTEKKKDLKKYNGRVQEPAYLAGNENYVKADLCSGMKDTGYALARGGTHGAQGMLAGWWYDCYWSLAAILGAILGSVNVDVTAVGGRRAMFVSRLLNLNKYKYKEGIKCKYKHLTLYKKLKKYI